MASEIKHGNRTNKYCATPKSLRGGIMDKSLVYERRFNVEIKITFKRKGLIAKFLDFYNSSET